MVEVLITLFLIWLLFVATLLFLRTKVQVVFNVIEATIQASWACIWPGLLAFFTLIFSTARILFYYMLEHAQAALYFLLIDKNGGNTLVAKEKDVVNFLADVSCAPGDHSISVFERCLLKTQTKRTKILTHAYYLFQKPSNGECHTLSFYGTKFALCSKGVWVMDSDSDMASHLKHADGNNEWDVAEICIEGGGLSPFF